MILNHLKNLNLKLQLEKLVIGVEEPVFIKGIGTMMAKSDSGNGAYNVIHGEDFYYQGNTVIFTTFDEEGLPHKISKKVQDTITINIGGGHTEDRPIVLFDVKFANDEYMNVPFTVGNRASNKNKVLLGKDFLVNELDAIIDVSSENLADKNIEVQLPVNEEVDQSSSILPNLKKQGDYKNPRLRIAGKLAASAGKLLGQLGRSDTTLWGAADDVLSNFKWYNNIKSYFSLDYLEGTIKQIEKNDEEIILSSIVKNLNEKGIPYTAVLTNPKIIKMLDYTGRDFSNKNKGEEYIKEKITEKQNNSGQTNTQQQNQQNQQTTQQQTNPTNNESIELKGLLVNEDNLAQQMQAKSKTPLKFPTNNTLDLSKKVSNEKSLGDKIKELADTSKPILYLVVYDLSNIDTVKNILVNQFNIGSSGYTELENIIDKMISTGNLNPTDTAEFCNKVITTLNEQSIAATFALVSGNGNSRQAKFITPIIEEENNYTKFLAQKVDFKVLIPFSKYKSLDNDIKNKFFIGTYNDNSKFGFRWFKENPPKNIDLSRKSLTEKIKIWMDYCKNNNIFEQPLHEDVQQNIVDPKNKLSNNIIQGINLENAYKAFTTGENEYQTSYTAGEDLKVKKEKINFTRVQQGQINYIKANLSNADKFTFDQKIRKIQDDKSIETQEDFNNKINPIIDNYLNNISDNSKDNKQFKLIPSEGQKERANIVYKNLKKINSDLANEFKVTLLDLKDKQYNSLDEYRNEYKDIVEDYTNKLKEISNKAESKEEDKKENNKENNKEYNKVEILGLDDKEKSSYTGSLSKTNIFVNNMNKDKQGKPKLSKNQQDEKNAKERKRRSELTADSNNRIKDAKEKINPKKLPDFKKELKVLKSNYKGKGSYNKDYRADLRELIAKYL